MMHQTLTGIFKRAGLPDAEIIATQFIGMGLMITTAEVLGMPQLRHAPI
ncbi:hypothetical protein G5B47_17490 [Paenibacillus sp. 7124]|uniref:Uncharacterized protein n=1 Tax=Paenibacillus apii TaxID=1850370 RepID=A0A6M1PL75_9BACL|nr:hypothetical protein [Paenibacillus apii]NGM84209.1 hypothetical protein [Paenibacillus apii]NJJ40895.1 hypothetical protein [Paenibacillus apii]